MLNKLGKLLKYEFRFYFRILPPLYLAIGLLAFLAGFQMKQSNLFVAVDSGFRGPLLTILWAAIITALMVMNIVMIIQRFTDNLLKNPGSLMFTLPVTSWAITASKAIAALCIVLISIVVISVSAFVYSAASDNWPHFIQITFTDCVIGIFICIAVALQQICLVYTVICASHLLTRFRFAVGVVAYFVVMNFAVQPVLRLFGGNWGGPQGHFSFIVDSMAEAIPYGIANLAFACLFFFAAGFLLKNKLNLE